MSDSADNSQPGEDMATNLQLTSVDAPPPDLIFLHDNEAYSLYENLTFQAQPDDLFNPYGVAPDPSKQVTSQSIGSNESFTDFKYLLSHETLGHSISLSEKTHRLPNEDVTIEQARQRSKEYARRRRKRTASPSHDSGYGSKDPSPYSSIPSSLNPDRDNFQSEVCKFWGSTPNQERYKKDSSRGVLSAHNPEQTILSPNSDQAVTGFSNESCSFQRSTLNPGRYQNDSTWKFLIPEIIEPGRLSPISDQAIPDVSNEASGHFQGAQEQNDLEDSVSDNRSSDYQSSSSSNHDTQPGTPQSCKDIELCFAKHRVLVSVMRYFYDLFGSDWQAHVAQCAGSRDSDAKQQSTNNQKGSAPSKRRARASRSADQSEDESSKKHRKPSNRQNSSGENAMLLACPFNKFDAQKYRPSISRGHRYRTCVGPGFATVSRLKTPLQRVHRLTQCQRCWQVLENDQKLTDHLNEDVRCPQRMPEPEGIDLTKMNLINSKHGASWDTVYEILFPGAQIPHPYWEPQTILECSEYSSSPHSQELQDYEAYSRRILPQLVEAHLSASLEQDLVPFEETLKARVGDLVRKLQSEVFENFQRLKKPVSVSQYEGNGPNNLSFLTAGAVDQLNANKFTSESSTHQFFREPALIDTTNESSCVTAAPLDNKAKEPPKSLAADSGYESFSSTRLRRCQSDGWDRQSCEGISKSYMDKRTNPDGQWGECASLPLGQPINDNSSMQWPELDFDFSLSQYLEVQDQINWNDSVHQREEGLTAEEENQRTWPELFLNM